MAELHSVIAVLRHVRQNMIPQICSKSSAFAGESELTEEASQLADLGKMATPMPAPGVIKEELIGKD